MNKTRALLLAGTAALVTAISGLASPCIADTASDQAFYKAGVAYQEKQEWEDALSAFHSMVERGTLAGDVSLRCAECYVKVNMPRAALAELSAGLPEVGGDVKSARLIVEKMAENVLLCKRYGSKGWDSLIAAYQRLARIDPENAPKYSQAIIDCCLKKSDWDAAVSACDFVIASYPKSDAAKAAALKKGEAYQGKGDVLAAVAAYAACAKQFPETAGEAALKASQCYLASGDVANSVRILKKCAASVSNDAKLAEVYRQLGEQCFSLGADAEAVAAMAKGLDVPETDRETTERMAGKLADYYVKTGQENKAAAVYTKLASLHPDRALLCQTQFARVLIPYNVSGSDQIVMEKFHAAESLSDATDLAIWHANDLAAFGKAEAAVSFITQAVAERPEIAKQAIPARAVIRDKFLRQNAEIVADYRQLLGMYPDCESVPAWKLEIAERLVYRLNGIAEAEGILADIVSSYPKFPRMIEAKYTLAMIPFILQDFKTAAQKFDEALACPEFGNYRALTLYMKAACYRHLTDKAGESDTADMLLGAYPDDCWAAQQENSRK